MARQPASHRERAFGHGVIDELRKARHQLGVSVADVARDTDASRDTIYALEAERTLSPGFFTVVELASRLDLSVEFLAAQGLQAAGPKSDGGDPDDGGQP